MRWGKESGTWFFSHAAVIPRAMFSTTPSWLGHVHCIPCATVHVVVQRPASAGCVHGLRIKDGASDIDMKMLSAGCGRPLRPREEVETCAGSVGAPIPRKVAIALLRVLTPV